jgi:hypothetical protein
MGRRSVCGDVVDPVRETSPLRALPSSSESVLMNERVAAVAAVKQCDVLLKRAEQRMCWKEDEDSTIGKKRSPVGSGDR